MCIAVIVTAANETHSVMARCQYSSEAVFNEVFNAPGLLALSKQG
jgi:hypothetical protein